MTAGAATAADRGRAAVYAAEQQVRALFDSADQHGERTVRTHCSTLTLPVERRFGSVESVQSYCDAVLALQWVRRRWPGTSGAVTVRTRRGAARAHYESDTAVVALPAGSDGRWALREFVVLHELAHHLAGSADTGHGDGFVTVLTELLDGVIGPEAAFLLRAALHGVGR